MFISYLLERLTGTFQLSLPLYATRHIAKFIQPAVAKYLLWEMSGLCNLLIVSTVIKLINNKERDPGPSACLKLTFVGISCLINGLNLVCFQRRQSCFLQYSPVS